MAAGTGMGPPPAAGREQETLCRARTMERRAKPFCQPGENGRARKNLYRLFKKRNDMEPGLKYTE